jgi:hypothetical protein
MLTIWELEEAKVCHVFSPGLAVALENVLPKSMPVLDLGCGRGTYLAHLAKRGFQCLGVEGTAEIQSIADFPHIVTADLSLPLEIEWPRGSVLCLEVAEHLAPKSEPQLLATIDRYCESWLVLSWAIVGQVGCGHNNCRPNTYVYDQMMARGFEFLPRETFVLRDAADHETPWFKNTLFVFRRAPTPLKS